MEAIKIISKEGTGMQYKKKISIMVSSLVLFFIMIILLVVIKGLYTKNEGDTVEFDGEIFKVKKDIF